MMKQKMFRNAALLSTIFVLPLMTGCGNVKNSLGLVKESPDEFAVITRAPLEIPSTLALPPPIPGMQRPQETSTFDSASEAVLGKKVQKQDESSAAESALLNKAGAKSTNPNIRAVVNKETQEMHDRNKPVAEKLLNIGGDKNEASATVVDPIKEMERIQKNKAEGKSILNGDTPIIEE